MDIKNLRENEHLRTSRRARLTIVLGFASFTLTLAATSINNVRENLRNAKKEYNKTEDDLKSLQSVGQIIGEVLRPLDNERLIVKASSGPRYVVGCRSKVDKEKLTSGTRVVLDMTTLTIMRALPREVDPIVYSMLHEDPGNVSYSAVGGLSDQIRELRESIELPLMNPELFLRVGIKPPKGVLLYGPPRTGKTLLARAIASNIDANFLKVVSSAIIDKYIGESARLIREMFGYARDHQFTSLPKYTSNVAMRTLKNFCQDNPSHKDINRGTLVVFNLDPSVSNEELRQIFGAYGEVKEVTLIIVNQWLSYRTTRESTQCSLIKDVNNIGTPCSTTKQTSPASNYRRAQDGVQRSIPTSLEMDAFFSSMERENQRLFIEKYVSGVASDSHWSVSNSDGNGELVLYWFGSVSQGKNYRDRPGVIFGSDDEAILVLFLIMLRSPRCEGSIASTHKIWRVREEFARIVAYAVTHFASIKLPLQRSILPPVFSFHDYCILLSSAFSF
ncbi:hypothetical protein ACFE04_027016 [Oxalis oulophora]